MLSIRTTTQSTEAVGVALETATAAAEAILGTDFARKTRLDRFHIDSEHYDRLRNGSTIRFLLEDGFLPDANARVYASTADLLRTSSATVVDRDYYLVDAEKGMLLLDGLPLTGMQSLAIRYTCGFKASGDEYQEVPAWLKQAAISSCIETLRSHAMTTNKKDNISDMSNQLTRTMRTILYAHVRPRYGGVFPMHSEIT